MQKSPALPPTFPRGAPPAFHLLAKPTGAICNLACEYCFFLSKEMLYPGSRFRMADDLLETYIRQLIESHRSPEVTIAWQGGEPTLMGLDFFERSVEYAERYRRPGQRISYTIQTNGTRLDDAWGTFLKAHDFLVGLSVDGPRAYHDAYRVDKGGKGSFDQVMRGWQVLKRHDVEFNILCTVHAANQDHPLDVYHFFRDDLGAQFMQFIPIVERATEESLPLANQGWSSAPSGKRPLYTVAGDLVTERSVRPEAYGRFLIAIFDEWVRRDVGTIFVQHFDTALANWMRVPGAVCIFSETCGQALALEHNGDLYCCDHFVEPAYRLGNIRQTHMIEMVASDRQRAFGLAKRDTLPRYCRECSVRFACHGECPRNRFISAPDGEPGLNYLCAAYKAFFTHIDHPMRLMVDLLRQGRYADEVMSLLAEDDQVPETHGGAEGRSQHPSSPSDGGETHLLV
ncbi:MAG TPA: anaerobic sulfatase maturase [Ktedonobacterales bacterium]|nr:anaerobic sulfatase maturase [Ktedonobacterales bacterium]